MFGFDSFAESPISALNSTTPSPYNNVYEVVSSADALTLIGTYNVAVAEILNTLDSVGITPYNLAVSDNLNVSDALTCNAQQLNQVAETLAVTEVQVPNSTFNVVTSDALTAADIVVGNLQVTLSLSEIGISDASALASLVRVGDITDSLNSADGLATTLNAVAVNTESLAAQDTQASNAIYPNTTADVLNAVTTQLGNFITSIAVAEVVSTNDSWVAQFLWNTKNTSHIANWQTNTTTQTANWATINTTQSANWTTIITYQD